MLVAWVVGMGGILMPLSTLAKHANRLDSSVLGMPEGPWSYVHRGAKGLETYLIPSQMDAIRRLPEPERRIALRFIRDHEANLSFLRKTSRRFFSGVNAEGRHAVPEYNMDLGEVMMGVDFENALDDNPIHPHEPILHALPLYTRVILLAPETALPKIRARLKTLGLSKRVRLVVSKDRAMRSPGEGVTRWVRDLGFVANDGKHALLLTSLAHKYFSDVSHNDLAYLARIDDPSHHVRQMPIFARGGNLAIAKAIQTALLVGSDEIKMNQQWFAEAFGYSPPPNALPDILKAATGIDQVAILPNSRNLFHLDMYITVLNDGTVGLLTPDDPENLGSDDRDTLRRGREVLQGLGFHIVPIPTSVERMKRFQSSTNIVTFVDRSNGRHRALVPLFPEPHGQLPSRSLNARVLAAYRNAGIDPVPVEDRFHLRWGNTHCALVPLH